MADSGVTRVVRIGATVRRPVRPFTATVQAYLRHLRERGVTFVPEAFGYDEQGREVLSFVPGDVPTEPLPGWATTEGVLQELARLVRALHDASEGWLPPTDAVWGSIPGPPPADLPALFDSPELVCHQDYCPGNVVLRAGLPAAFIDFDLARPTTRVLDSVNASPGGSHCYTQSTVRPRCARQMPPGGYGSSRTPTASTAHSERPSCRPRSPGPETRTSPCDWQPRSTPCSNVGGTRASRIGCPARNSGSGERQTTSGQRCSMKRRRLWVRQAIVGFWLRAGSRRIRWSSGRWWDTLSR